MIKMDNPQLKIPLFLKREKIGHLTIVSVYPSTYIGSNFENSVGIFSNVPKHGESDAVTPIQCRDLRNGHLIMLLEETRYQIYFKPLQNCEDIEILPTIQENRYSVYEPFNWDTGDTIAGTLNFGSYAGKSYFDVKINGERTDPVPFEVRSKKIDYQNHYTQMIVDLSKAASGILFHQKAPLFGRFYFGDELSNSNYEDYMFLEYLFLEENLPFAYEYVRKNVYVNLEEHVETVPTSFASNLGNSGMVNIICSPEYLHESKNPPLNWPSSMKNFVPESINQSFYEDSVDTTENQLLKYFLELIDTLIQSLMDELQEENYIYGRLALFDEIIDEYLSDRWLEDVGKLQMVPMNSQVLQKKEGYRSIFKYYLNFEFGFRPEWGEIEELISGYERKLSELYEFWCYFELLKIIERLTNTKLNYDDVFELKSNDWEVSPKVGLRSKQNFNFNMEGEEIRIKLFYNKSFRQNSYYEAYSLNLRPDYTLEINFNNQNYFLHFDAKYKSKGILKDEGYNKKDHIYKHEDVYKMHTYKDAILNTKGAYVLYPGNKAKIFREKEEIIPSVGAFPLTPGNNREQEEELSRYIFKFIKTIYNESKN